MLMSSPSVRRVVRAHGRRAGCVARVARARVGKEHTASPMNRRRISRQFAHPAEETPRMSSRGTDSNTRLAGDPTGLHRVLDDAVVLPQAAQRLDARREIWPDEVRGRVETLNLDAASFRQLEEKHDHDGDGVRREVLAIVAARGKMHNPVTGSGGMLIGTVEEAGPDSPLGLAPGDRVATLVSLTLTPLVITDGLARWDGRGEQIPAAGHAILFARSVAAVLPDDLPAELALAVMDVCGAPALTARVTRSYDAPA